MLEVVEITPAGERSPSLFFPPLQRRVRGRFDARDEADGAAMGPLLVAWPRPLPGQVLGLRPDGSAYLREPLHGDEHAQDRAKIEAQGMTLNPECEELGPADVPTWLHWAKRSVAAGLARVVRGRLPEKVEGRPRLQFISPEREDPRDERLDRLEEQNRKLLALLVATLPADKRRAVERELAGQEDT